ncbi:MAG: hypothetical protein HYX27_23140 [Acidobacteria bacterium]|nr:hypothetical protein [Acidobacteriota bacterium]
MLRLLMPLLLAAAHLCAQQPLEIIRATYGAGTTQADVTSRVQSYIVNGAIQIPVNAGTMGGDPVPNTPKILTVIYRLGNQRRTIRISDFDTLRLGGDANTGALRITKAQYGDGRRMKDVADVLTSKISANRLELVISNNNLGGDPAPAVKKYIAVVYDYNGRTGNVKVNEGDTLLLPTNNDAPVSNLRIIRALYTSRRGSVDVSNALSRQISNDGLELTVNSASLGADPAPGVIKTLAVVYELNGLRQSVNVKDGEVLRINRAAPVPTLRIIRASYGSGRRANADVTAAVTNRVSNNTLELPVNGDTLGIDPAIGSTKTLTVEYELDGQRQVATARDTETLFLPPVTSLTIYSATYGVPGRSINATQAVAARVSNYRAEIPVNDATLGGDPAPNVVKTLTVEYEVNGRRTIATAQDGQTLRLPGGGTAATVPMPVTPVPGTRPVDVDVVRSRGACLYRQPNYTGDPVCLSRGQDLPVVSLSQGGFRSVRLNGATLDVYEQPNFGGRTQTLSSDSPDLLQVPGAWWRYDSAAPVQSVRAR